MNEQPFLEGEHVILRPLALEDVSETYIAWLNDEKVCEYNSHHVYPYTLELAREYVTRIRSQKQDLVLAIIAKNNGAHIGNISLQNINQLYRSAEYAVLLGDKNYWGKGLGKEASRLILWHGFNTMNLHRIHCGTSVENIPMQKLAASLGFVEEGRRREAMFKNGAYLDVIEYGMLKSDFKP
jgi:RimJ/RimL family protein N-acetyltransferase